MLYYIMELEQVCLAYLCPYNKFGECVWPFTPNRGNQNTIWYWQEYAPKMKKGD